MAKNGSLTRRVRLVHVSEIRRHVQIATFEAWTLFCYVWPKQSHRFRKNLYTPTALFFSPRTVNALVTSHAPQAEMAIELDAAFALWLFLTIHVQRLPRHRRRSCRRPEDSADHSYARRVDSPAAGDRCGDDCGGRLVCHCRTAALQA